MKTLHYVGIDTIALKLAIGQLRAIIAKKKEIELVDKELDDIISKIVNFKLDGDIEIISQEETIALTLKMGELAKEFAVAQQFLSNAIVTIKKNVK